MGGTLLSDPQLHEARSARIAHVADWLSKRGAECSGEDLEAAFRSADEAAKRSWANGRVHFGASESLTHILDVLDVACPRAEQADLIALLEEPFPGRRLPAVDGAREALDRFRAAGVRLGIVSNLGYGPGRAIRRYLDDGGLLEFFEPEAIAFSDEVGFLKPDERIFAAALDALGVPPERAAHVGDLRSTDVAGARALGMFAVRFAGVYDDDTDGPEADAVVRAYVELPEALGL